MENDQRAPQLHGQGRRLPRFVSSQDRCPLLGWTTRSCLPSGWGGSRVVLMSTPLSRSRRNSHEPLARPLEYTGTLSVVTVLDATRQSVPCDRGVSGL